MCAVVFAIFGVCISGLGVDDRSHDSDVTRSPDQSTAKDISEEATLCISRSLGLDIGAQNLNIECMAANQGIIFNICGNGNSPKE